jgi:hypothetical protein
VFAKGVRESLLFTTLRRKEIAGGDAEFRYTRDRGCYSL